MKTESTSANGNGVSADHPMRIVVVGNGDFMFPNQQTGYGRQYSGLGALMLLNMVDWLVQDEALVSIRSKGVPRVLKDLGRLVVAIRIKG